MREREDTPPDTPSEYFLRFGQSSRLAAMQLQFIRTSPAITDRQRQIVALIAAGSRGILRRSRALRPTIQDE